MNSLQGRAPSFAWELATAGRSGVPFFSVELVEGSTEFVLVFAFLLVSRTGTGDGCFSSWATSLRLKSLKLIGGREDHDASWRRAKGARASGISSFHKRKGATKGDETNKLVGWSTENTEEEQRHQSLNTRKKWCSGGASIKKKEWTKCGKHCRKMKEEVLVKYKVEVSNRGAYKGRGEPSEWRMVQRVNKYQPWKWVKTVRRQSTSRFQGMRFAAKERHAGKLIWKEWDEAPAKDEDHGRYDYKDQGKRQNGREHQLVGQWAADCNISVGSPWMGGYNAAVVQLAVWSEKEGWGEEDGGGASKDFESNDRQCSIRSRLAAQDHGTNSLERMSADSEEGRTRCQAVDHMWGEEEIIGNALAHLKVQDLEDTPRRNEELKNLEADMPRLLEKAAKSCKAKTGVVCDCFHPKVPLDLTKETRGKVVEILEQVLQCGRWPQQARTRMFFPWVRRTLRPSVPLRSCRWWFVGGKPCERQRLRSGNTNIVLNGIPLMDEMEELSALCGRLCLRWKDVWETLLEMERFTFHAVWKRSRNDSTGAWLCESLRASQLVWAWARHVHFPKNKTRMLCWYFEHQRRVQFGGCVAEPLQDHHGHSPWVKVELLAPAHCVSGRPEKGDQNLSVAEIEGVCGWHHSSLEKKTQGVGGDGRNGSEEIEKRGRRKGPEAVDHWRRERRKE